MKKLTTAILGLSLLVGSAAFAQDNVIDSQTKSTISNSTMQSFYPAGSEGITAYDDTSENPVQNFASSSVPSEAAKAL